MEVDPAAVMGNCTTSSANYESSPGQILSSLQTVLSVSLQGSEAGSPPGVPTVVPVLASQVVVTDLAAPMLADHVMSDSSLWLGLRGIRCGKPVPPLAGMPRPLQQAGQGGDDPGHTPASQSALYQLLTDDMFPLDLLQDLVLLLDYIIDLCTIISN